MLETLITCYPLLQSFPTLLSDMFAACQKSPRTCKCSSVVWETTAKRILLDLSASSCPYEPFPGSFFCYHLNAFSWFSLHIAGTASHQLDEYQAIAMKGVSQRTKLVLLPANVYGTLACSSQMTASSSFQANLKQCRPEAAMLLPQSPVFSLCCLYSLALLSLLHFVFISHCGWTESSAAHKANVTEMAAWVVCECLFSGTYTEWGGKNQERNGNGCSKFVFKEKRLSSKWASRYALCVGMGINELCGTDI